MARIDDIISGILASDRFKNSKAFKTAKAFGDEPILKRGSQATGYLPEQYRLMHEIAQSADALSWSRDRLFVEQARYMKDAQDDYPFSGSFEHYYPTYADMTPTQLRGYFSWRTKLRRGERPSAPTSFLYVYCYELLNGIGVREGEEAFRALESFWRTYRADAPGMDRHVAQWLLDYAALYKLDHKLAIPYVKDGHGSALALLQEEEERILAQNPRGKRRTKTRDYLSLGTRAVRIAHAMAEVSTYHPDRSRFAKEHEEDYSVVLLAVFERLALLHRSGRNQALVQSLFGVRAETPHRLFLTAVTWLPTIQDDRDYRISDSMTYRCRSGRWTIDSYGSANVPSKKLGLVLRLLDFELRQQTQYPHALKEPSAPKYLRQIIHEETESYLAWKAEHAPRKIVIDYARLQNIRTAAARTRESLLTDEERLDEVAPDVSPAPSAQEAIADVATDGPLNSEQRQVLAALLLQENAPTQITGSAELAADAINEVLYDLIGDTVLEFGEDGRLQLVNDYCQDVAEVLGMKL